MASRTVRQAESIREGVWVSWVLMGVVVGALWAVLCWSSGKGVEPVGGAGVADREFGLVVAKGMGYFEGGVECLSAEEVSELGVRVEEALVGVLERGEVQAQRGVGRVLGRMESGSEMGVARCELVRRAWREVRGDVR